MKLLDWEAIKTKCEQTDCDTPYTVLLHAVFASDVPFQPHIHKKHEATYRQEFEKDGYMLFYHPTRRLAYCYVEISGPYARIEYPISRVWSNYSRLYPQNVEKELESIDKNFS